MKKIKTMNQTQFAAHIGNTKGYVSQLKSAGRMVFTMDGKVDVEASIIRINETQDPNRLDVKQRHSENRSKPRAPTVEEICNELLSGKELSQEFRVAAVACIRKSQTIELSRSRADKEHWLGLQAKLDYETALGLVVMIDEVRRAISDLITTFRQSLENRGHRIAADLVSKDFNYILRILKQDDHASLSNLERACNDKIQNIAKANHE